MEGLGLAREEALDLRPPAPEPRLAALVSNSENADFGLAKVVDDAVREPAQRKPPDAAAPACTNARLFKQQSDGTLELRDECVAEFDVSLADIEQRALDQFLLCLDRK